MNKKISPRSAPIAILILCILSYGLYLSWMGFYWDDWPWVWFSQVMGSNGMFRIDLEHRPLSGLVLWIGSLLAGESPLGWQIYNFTFRLLTGVSLWWMLKTLWPRHQKFTIVVTLLFLVYPGFGQQFVAVNNSRHLLPLALFFISLGWMIKACRDRSHYWRYTSISLGLSIISMLISDYYYGLELIRPAILWFMYEQSDYRQRLRNTLRDWLPYLILLAGIFIWRYWVSQHYFYRVSIFDSPSETESLLATKLIDPIEVTIGAWAQIFNFPQYGVFGSRTTILFFGLIVVGSLIAFGYLWMLPGSTDAHKWYLKPLALGIFAVIIAFLPFWATDLDAKLIFPNDRLTLPMMLGASLILASTIFGLVRSRLLQTLLLAVLIGLGMGVQIQNAQAYRQDWRYQAAFFEQLTWRAPRIKQGTAILSNELPNQFSTDNSLTAPLNWIYDPDFSGGDLPMMMFYTSRFGEDLSYLTSETPLQDVYRFYPFNGKVGESIVVYHVPPACLRVLDPIYDLHYPLLPEDMRSVQQFSDPLRIMDSNPTAVPLVNIFDKQPMKTWCYYFEKADLARQDKDWELVAEIGDIAFSLDDSPNHASERVPFIEGYAHVGYWKKAINLTQEALEINKFMEPMLCDTWQRIIADVPASDKKTEALHEIQQIINCNSQSTE